MRSIWLVAVIGIIACKDGDKARSYSEKSKRTEAQLQMFSMDTGSFPVGKAGPKPTVDCCKGAEGRCPVESDWGGDPTWRMLHFQIDDPNRFRYSYESDGKTANAIAVGDLDCDGVMITYKLLVTTEGTQIKSTLIEPAADAD
ncbi:MAG: hypothetical protein ABIQ53_00360 [Terracoccus sp.]